MPWGSSPANARVSVADAADHQLVCVHLPAVLGLLQGHRELVDPVLVQGRAGILHHGSHHHLGIGAAHVGKVGGLTALFQLGRKNRDGHRDEDGRLTLIVLQVVIVCCILIRVSKLK